MNLLLALLDSESTYSSMADKSTKSDLSHCSNENKSNNAKDSEVGDDRVVSGSVLPPSEGSNAATNEALAPMNGVQDTVAAPLAPEVAGQQHPEAASTSAGSTEQCEVSPHGETDDGSPKSEVASSASLSQQNKRAAPDGGSSSVTATKKAKKATGKPKRDDSSQYSTGRWSEAEHRTFLQGLAIYGREWKRVAVHIPSRTSAQVRSHAQKYFAKLNAERAEQQAAAAAESVAASSSSARVGTSAARPLSASVQRNVERILQEPETVQAEVNDTMRRLHERYAQLQRRLQQQQQSSAAAAAPVAQRAPQDQGQQPPEQPDAAAPPQNDDEHGSLNDGGSSWTSQSIESLQDSELIALNVLRGGLPNAAGGRRQRQQEQQQQQPGQEAADAEPAAEGEGASSSIASSGSNTASTNGSTGTTLSCEQGTNE